MKEPTHAPLAFANGLSAKLATRSRHVAVFLAAGASKACGLPDVAALQVRVLERLDKPDRAVVERQLKTRNLEQVLSRLRRIAALVDGKDRVDGLDATGASRLDASVCQAIVEQLSTEGADLSPMLRFAGWAARTDYVQPLEVFTVNYDLLVETALEQLGVPYFDGFVGALRGRFRIDLVEASPEDGDAWLPRFVVRLWKLHGSVHWAWEAGDRPEVVRVGAPVGETVPAAIYPSDAKYEESRRVPFVVLQDRLRRSLNEPESLTIVSGYSWSDAHLNELLFEAASRRPRSEIVAFCYSRIPEILAERAQLITNLQAVTGDEAVIGGTRAPWAPPDEPLPADVWDGDKLALRDFRHLSSFLSRSASPQRDADQRLEGLLARGARAVDG